MHACGYGRWRLVVSAAGKTSLHVCLDFGLAQWSGGVVKRLGWVGRPVNKVQSVETALSFGNCCS